MKSQLIKNQILSNYFQTTFQNPNNQSPTFDKNQNTTSKNPFQSTQKKSNKIKQTKQLLAQKLKQVSPIQSAIENQQSTKATNNNVENSQKENKIIDCHFNPISKLTKQPFVRSKTCEQMRKQFSLKKARKRNNTASKFNTPNTEISQRHAQSTGINSTKNPLNQTSSNKKSSEKINMKKHTASSIETKQFSLDPYNFGGPMIETFSKAQIEKLSSLDFQKNKIKPKLTLGKRTINNSKEIVDVPSQLNFPFKINAKGSKKQEVQIKNQLVLQASFRNIEEKFTPRLQRYPLSGQLNQGKDMQKRSSKQLESIELSQQNEDSKNSRQPTETLEEEPEIQEEDYEMNDGDTSYGYSSQQPSKDAEYMNQQQQSSLGYSERDFVNQKELMASLHITNTILQEKLKLKEQEINELNRNYFELKTELIQARNIKSQRETTLNDTKQSSKTQEDNYDPATKQISTMVSKSPKYLTNFDLQKIVYSIDTVNNSKEVVNINSKEVQSIQSTKYYFGVQEEFNRQREIIPQEREQDSRIIYQSFNPSYGKLLNNSNKSRFNKKQEFFPSGLQQYVSQQFDSKEIYQKIKHDPPIEINRGKKKNSFNSALVKLNLQNKRDSLVYTLNDEFSINESSQKHINASFLDSSSKKGSSHIPTEEMLLDSDRTHQPMQSSQDDRISQLSPIKFNENEKMENMQSRYLKFKESFGKGQYIPFEESFNKFQYCLTPQKDEGQIEDSKPSRSQSQEGLFQKAFSTLKKSKDESPFKQLESNFNNISQNYI